MLQFFNSASRKLEPFVPLVPGKVGLYTCGPTVYWDAHIGNFRSYIFEDILQRTLELEGLQVKRVMNITDVGHLTDDADEGEDKMEKGAAREGKSVWEVAKTYTEHFLVDAGKLNLKLPDPPLLCRATDHIPEQIVLVQELEKKGFTYRTSGEIYFDTSKFPAYGSLSGQKLDEKQGGARVELSSEKKNKTDFALWKFSPKDSTRQMEWESPWGVGFPGWHIECSAMAREFLGQPFDIHCGGVDHIPVHHENEIAQSEAAYGEKLANFWLHNEFLLVDGQKMSKSLGNVYTISQLEEKHFNPLAFRYLMLGAHYRQKQNFTWEALQGAQNALSKLYAIARELPLNPFTAPKGAETAPLLEFTAALEDDLNTPIALAAMWKMLDGNLSPSEKSEQLIAMDTVLGLNLADYLGVQIKIPIDIQALVDERAQVRDAKDWKRADEIRDALGERGWMVEDGKDGQRIRPAA